MLYLVWLLTGSLLHIFKLLLLVEPFFELYLEYLSVLHRVSENRYQLVSSL